MKRIFAWFLAFLLVLALAACGDDAATDAIQEAPAEDPSAVEEETPEENSPEESGEESPSEEVSEETVDIPAEEPQTEVSFEEITVVDNDECVVKITGLDPDNLWGYTLNVFLENKSADKNYMFSVSSAAVNGVQCDPLFATEVAAGKKANEEISLLDSSLEENGITEFTDLELSFRVYDSDDWIADPVAEETVHVYPLGEDKATLFSREPQAADQILVDNDAVTVIVTGYRDDSFWGPTVDLFLVNKTDTDVMFSVDNVSVNGFMADPLYATTVAAGKCAFSSMSWMTGDLDDANVTKIEEIEEIELTFRAYNNDDWFAEDYFQETITLTPGV